jgi:processive 1,2-diacylglycerol beta-glucosyltransferase
MKKKRILILSGSTGGGHVSAALALEKCAVKNFKNIEVIHVDIIEYMSKLFKKMYADTYNNIIINSPGLYGYLYSITNHSKNDKRNFILNKLRYYFEEFFTLKLKRVIKRIQPDVLICTHFLPAEHLNDAVKNRKYAAKYAVVITDYDVHWLWVQKNMDMFFVATAEESARLNMMGVAQEKISVTGIPIKPEFCVEYNKIQMRKKLGIDEDKNVILIMTGAYGAGKIKSLIERLLKTIKEDYQMIVMTGKNRQLYKLMKVISSDCPGKLYPVGFTKEVYKYMAVSDFALTKTGGLTTSECIAMGLPIITLDPIPGQEDRNTNFLLENGACFRAFNFSGLIYRIEKLLKDRDLLMRMQKNAKRISKPNAAYNILNLLLDD